MVQNWGCVGAGGHPSAAITPAARLHVHQWGGFGVTMTDDVRSAAQRPDLLALLMQAKAGKRVKLPDSAEPFEIARARAADESGKVDDQVARNYTATLYELRNKGVLTFRKIGERPAPSVPKTFAVIGRRPRTLDEQARDERNARRQASLPPIDVCVIDLAELKDARALLPPSTWLDQWFGVQAEQPHHGSKAGSIKKADAELELSRRLSHLGYTDKCIRSSLKDHDGLKGEGIRPVYGRVNVDAAYRAMLEHVAPDDPTSVSEPLRKDEQRRLGIDTDSTTKGSRPRLRAVQ